MDDLVLLDEREAVHKHFDLKNYVVLNRSLALFGLFAAVGLIAGVVDRAPLRGALALVGLLLVVAFFAFSEADLFARHFRHLSILFLLLELLLLVVSVRDSHAAVVLAGFAFPLALLVLRLRVSEYLLLAVAFWIATALCLYRQMPASGQLPLRTFVTASVWIAAMVAAAAGLAARQRQAFLLDWRREHSRSRERLRMREEIDYARRIQVAMLPQAPPDLPWIELAAFSLPATEVGGDYYDYFQLSPSRLAVVIGDVAGHGLASGLLLSGVRSCLYLLADELGNPVGVLGRLDRMVRQTTERRTFVTLLCTVLDGEAGTLTLATAGHPPLLHFSARERRLEEVGQGAPPLGTWLKATYRQETRPLARGDLLVLYSDGLPEARDHLGRDYGEERFRRVLERVPPGSSARLVCEAVREDLANFKGDAEQLDDITIVVARMR